MIVSVCVLLALVSLAAGQTCSTNVGSTGPCVSGLCPTGYTCSTFGASNICCLTSNVVSCVDKTNPSTGVSDCTRLSYLCSNSAYYSLMTTQCPRTCGRCSVAATTVTSSCVDLTNPSTGVSDCGRLSTLCSNSAYYSLMTTQCPRTCGRCSG